MEKRAAEEIRSVSYELFIISLTYIQVFNLVLLLLPIGVSAYGVVLLISQCMTVIFMVDFLFRLLTARSKSDYFLRHYGWADLIGSLPAILSPYVLFLRLFRLVRAVRLTRQLGGRSAVRSLRQQRAGNTLTGVLLMVVIVLEAGGIAILEVEGGLPEALIHTPVQAIWWGIVTMATVGYGDFYPVTNTGRMIGVFVILMGVTLLGVFSGSVANYFLRPRKGEQAAAIGSDREVEGTRPGEAALMEEIQRLRDELAERDERIEARLKALEGGGGGTASTKGE